MTGPVLDAPDVAELARFYERFLGWEIVELAGPRPDHPEGDGWAMLRPPDRSTKIEIQFEEHFVPPVYPGASVSQGMQIHLDYQVDDVPQAVAWAIECGATEAEWQPPTRDHTRLRVMLDPAGHPFCLWS
jgi:catechol 2,3-dioxygenase-like lactoylglutathione lyase family enzyme